VLTPQLADAPGKVAIYGWHQLDGTANQPCPRPCRELVDYSHGVRLVRREMTLNGSATTVDAVLADPKTCALLSDEGAIGDYRYGSVHAVLTNYPGEKNEELHLDGGVRVVINSPAKLDPAKPTRLVLFALPAGNTIEQTIGHQLAPGDELALRHPAYRRADALASCARVGHQPRGRLPSKRRANLRPLASRPSG